MVAQVAIPLPRLLVVPSIGRYTQKYLGLTSKFRQKKFDERCDCLFRAVEWG